MNYVFLDILTSTAILFILAYGLLIIFGVMKIINFAHAGFLAVGAYAGVMGSNMGWGPWWSYPFSFLLGCFLGIIVERLILHFLYDRPLDAILGTWGLGIVLVQIITAIFGRGVQFSTSPIAGATEIFGAFYSQYRLWLIIFAVLIGIVMWLLLHATRIGLYTRAVI